MSKKSFRVYFVTREGGRMTGALIRAWDSFFDSPAPAAFGGSEADVYAQLEVELERIEIEGKESLDRYLWDEEFQTRTIHVDVHPLSTVKKRPVIGKREIPLHLTYASCPLKGGGHRVMLPRFGGWFVLEDLALAPEVLRHAVSAALLGENPRSLYDFRHEGEEYVREWTPPLLKARGARPVAKEQKQFPTLSQVAEELVDRASRGKVPRPLGASEAFERLQREPLRSPPRSLLLVGPPGVGKTSLVHRLAHSFVLRKREEEGTRVPRLWSTSADKIVAGMIYLGMWEERCQEIVRELSLEGDCLHVDRLGPLLAPQGGGTSIADVLDPAIAAGEIALIAECTDSELESARRRAPSFCARFTPVRVDAPSEPAMLELLDAYAAKRGARIHAAGLRRLLRHLDAFQRDAAFPGKALRFVDWLTGEANEANTRRPPLLYPRDVSAAYARFSGIPFHLLSDDVPAPAGELAAWLKAKVIAQDEACDACGRLLARFKATLSDPERPTGTLLFVGPTGVGKTELAKQLAAAAFGDGGRLVRLDMSEYMHRGSAARLLDTGPGVRSLAAEVRDQPLSLVLFDEIEKAHPEVFDLLLGVLGEGRLTDGNGRLIDFRGTIVVMTSNLGVQGKRAVGFQGTSADDFTRAVRRHFRPEFFNRIDHVLSFRPLGRDDVVRIVDLELDKLRERTGLVRRAIRLEVSAEAKRRLAALGYDPDKGARPLKRVLEERVLVPIAARMAEDAAFRDQDVAVVAAGEAAPGKVLVVIEDGG